MNIPDCMLVIFISFLRLNLVENSSPVDLTLVLDTSTIPLDHFILYKNAVKSFVNVLGVEDKGNRLALICFNSKRSILLSLSEGLTLDKVTEAVDSIPEPEDGRNTHLALASIADEIYVPRSGDREDVIKVAVLITTGASYLPYSTLTEANRLKQAGVFLFVVGVGQWVRDAEIQFLSTKPSSFFSRRAASVSLLNATLLEMAPNEGTAADQPRILECNPLFDLAFIVDASNAISAKGFKRQKRFVDKLASSFDISPRAVRVALIAFDKKSRIVFNLQSYTSYSPMKTAILSVSQTGPGRVLDKAMRFARNAIFTKVRFDESGIPVPQVLVIITGGKTRYVQKSLREAERLKSQGITIFTIHVGKRMRPEMTRIASIPANRYSFNIRGYGLLDKVYADMVDTTCKELARVTQRSIDENFEYGHSLPAEECQGESDIMFLFQIPPSPEEWGVLRSYLQTVIRHLNISTDAIRVGLTAFRNSLLTITSLQQSAGKNETILALNYFNPTKLNSEGTWKSSEFTTKETWREEVVKILVIVYGNGANVGILNEILNGSHRQDVMRFVINLGKPLPELANTLASEPKSSHIVYSPYLDNLTGTVPYLIDRICDESIPAHHVLIW